MKYAITVNEVKDSPNGLKGFASVTLGESFKIINVAIMENAETKELFVSMPRYKINEKDENQKDIYQDICNPITKEFREQLYGDILTAFVTRNEKGKAKGKEETEAEMPKYVHALMIGAAGVGKTAYWLYPCIEYACASGMSFLSTDTKGDVMRNYGTTG